MMVAKKSFGTLCPGVAMAWNLANLFGSWTHSSNRFNSGSQTLIYASSLKRHSLASLKGSRQTGSKVRLLVWHFKSSRASAFDSFGCFWVILLEFLFSSYLMISFLHLSKFTNMKIMFYINKNNKSDDQDERVPTSMAGMEYALPKSKSTCWELWLL